MQEKPEYYTAEEVAEKLRIRKETVWKYIRDKQLRATKLGKHYRITPADLQDFLDKRTPPPEET